jgi:hypothetical protein
MVARWVLQYAECFIAFSEEKTAMILFNLDMKGIVSGSA